MLQLEDRRLWTLMQHNHLFYNLFYYESPQNSLRFTKSVHSDEIKNRTEQIPGSLVMTNNSLKNTQKECKSSVHLFHLFYCNEATKWPSVCPEDSS
jgi:hypothetical protein